MNRQFHGLLFLITLCGTIPWFLTRLAPSIVFGPWSGPSLRDTPSFPIPFVSRWIRDLVLLIPVGAPAWRLNLISMLAGAMACGAVAVITSTLLRRQAAAWRPNVAGLAAGLLFAILPDVLYESTGAGPATLSAALALGAVAVYVQPIAANRAMIRFAITGFLAGWAAANHPALALTAGVLLLSMFLPADRASKTALTLRIGAFGLGFCAAASGPIYYALVHGETFQEFLRHALQTTYPVLFEGTPQWDFAHDLMKTVPIVLLALGLAGLLFLRDARLRTGITLLLFLFLCQGPFLPMLTHQSISPWTADPAAPRLLALAVLCCFAGLGIAWISQGIQSPRRGIRAAAVGILAGMTVLLFIQWPALPQRRHNIAETLGKELLAACPDTGTVWCGDPNLASLILAAQSLQTAKHLEVLPIDLLIDTAWRPRYLKNTQGTLQLAQTFPPPNAKERWQRHLPFQWLALTEDTAPLSLARLRDFALWDAVIDNPQQWPFIFLGVQAAWLPARAQNRGGVLAYPRDAVPEVKPPLTEFLEQPMPNDPALKQTFAILMTALGESALQQDRPGEAERYARAAAAWVPDSAPAALLLLRVQARHGDRKALLETAEYPALWTASDAETTVKKTVETALNLFTAQTALEDYLAQTVPGETNWAEREPLLRPFWEADELGFLLTQYRKILEQNSEDLDAWYQSAAVHAQLGQWADTQTALTHWATLSGYTETQVQQKLDDDGRFALWLVRKSAP